MGLDVFLDMVGKLKETKRTGWVERGVNDPESVSDHSYMTALMCMIIQKEGIDREKVIKMAIVHDVAESITGDIITTENWPEGGTMSSAERTKLEEQSIMKLIPELNESAGKEILDLWKEYEDGKTPEALFVKDIDVAERTIQAYRYHRKGNTKRPLSPFWRESNLNSIKDDDIRELVLKIIEKK